MIVESLRGTHRATLSQEDAGVHVVVDRVCASSRWTVSKQLWSGVIEAPLHLVADHIEAVIQQLEDNEWVPK